MSKIIELAKKLNELAKRGEGGERETAESMLKSLCKKHDISIEEIEGEAIKEYYVKIKKEDFTLFHQIVRHVTQTAKLYGEFDKKTISQYRLKGNYMVECTASEYVEIEAKNNFYQRLYKEEVKSFLGAFIMANDLYGGTSSKSEFTDEELEKYMKQAALAKGITKGQFNKQLNAVNAR